MNFTLRRAGCVVAALATLALAASAAAQRHGNDGVFSPDSRPYDQSYAKWTESWWSWVMAIPFDVNPMNDATGDFQSTDQCGPVWFLAGTNGLSGPMTRTCEIPSDKAVLFPLMNYLNDYDPWNPDNPNGPGPLPPGVSLTDWLTPFAKQVIDSTFLLEAEVDGKPLRDLWDYRFTTRAFIFRADPSMIAADPVVNPNGYPQPGVSDGYWIMLRPLSEGRHTIHYHAKAEPFPGFFFEQDVTYHLKVVDRRHR